MKHLRTGLHNLNQTATAGQIMCYVNKDDGHNIVIIPVPPNILSLSILE